MKNFSLYALCMSAVLLCLPLASYGDDDKEEYAEAIGSGSGNGVNDDENTNEEDDTSTDVMVCEAVDLGLSVKWATCNVGASSPEEYGDYYAWGETDEKGYYDWNTYKYCGGTGRTLTKYCTDVTYGTIDNNIVLEFDDDVAQVKWGDGWRMPTSREVNELMTNCTWTWTALNGVSGYAVTSKVNGNSIFLPAVGYRWLEVVDSSGSNGRYWSTSLHEDGSSNACYLYFDSGDRYMSDFYRNCGFSVRPVTE